MRGTTTTRTARTSSTCTCATSARRSTGRSASVDRDSARRRLPAARTRGGALSRLPIRCKAHARLRGRHGRGAGGHGALRVPALRRRARRARSNTACARAPATSRTDRARGNAASPSRAQRPLVESGESFAQVLDARRAASSTARPQLRPSPLLDGRRARARAARDRHLRPRRRRGGRRAGAAARDAGHGARTALVVVVGASLDDRNESLEEPARCARDRRPGRAAARVARGLRRRGRRPATGGGDATQGRRRSPTDEPGERLPVPRARRRDRAARRDAQRDARAPRGGD